MRIIIPAICEEEVIPIAISARVTCRVADTHKELMVIPSELSGPDFPKDLLKSLKDFIPGPQRAYDGQYREFWTPDLGTGQGCIHIDASRAENWKKLEESDVQVWGKSYGAAVWLSSAIALLRHSTKRAEDLQADVNALWVVVTAAVQDNHELGVVSEVRRKYDAAMTWKKFGKKRIVFLCHKSNSNEFLQSDVDYLLISTTSDLYEIAEQCVLGAADPFLQLKSVSAQSRPPTRNIVSAEHGDHNVPTDAGQAKPDSRRSKKIGLLRRSGSTPIAMIAVALLVGATWKSKPVSHHKAELPIPAFVVDTRSKSLVDQASAARGIAFDNVSGLAAATLSLAKQLQRPTHIDYLDRFCKSAQSGNLNRAKTYFRKLESLQGKAPQKVRGSEFHFETLDAINLKQAVIDLCERPALD